jgi:hypothetical protein
METQHDQEVPMTTTTLAFLSLDTVRVKPSKRRKVVPAAHVQNLLREIVIAMHATRAIGKVEQDDEANGTEE